MNSLERLIFLPALLHNSVCKSFLIFIYLSPSFDLIWMWSDLVKKSYAINPLKTARCEHKISHRNHKGIEQTQRALNLIISENLFRERRRKFLNPQKMPHKYGNVRLGNSILPSYIIAAKWNTLIWIQKYGFLDQL